MKAVSTAARVSVGWRRTSTARPGLCHDVNEPRRTHAAPELARHAITEGICTSISSATVRRLLAEDALKPWQYQSWIFLRDPDFATKAEKVLDLYARTWHGQPLSDNEFVISADEKPPSKPAAAATPACPRAAHG